MCIFGTLKGPYLLNYVNLDHANSCNSFKIKFYFYLRDFFAFLTEEFEIFIIRKVHLFSQNMCIFFTLKSHISETTSIQTMQIVAIALKSNLPLNFGFLRDFNRGI